MMKNARCVLRRVGALALSALTLWTAVVTAGSKTLQAAAEAVEEAIPLGVLRWTLGDVQQEDELTLAAVLTLSQSPLLRAARPAVARLWSLEQGEPEAPQRSDIVEERPVEPPDAGDNGVPARTLMPRDPSGYTVCGRAYIKSTTDHALSVPELQELFSAQLTGEEPQMLILHTHGSEAYIPVPGEEVVWSGNCRSTDTRYNVVGVGDAMAEEFNAAGISVLHDRTLYDYPNYNGSYDRSLAAMESYLAQYPSIRFILDIHRDAIEDQEGNQYKVISDLDGTPTAQMTLVVGSDGSGAPHKEWKENLKLAVALQNQILAEHPTLMRPILLRNSRYNQHLTTGSLLVEVGAAGNSPEEARRSGRLLARELAALLEGRSK